MMPRDRAEAWPRRRKNSPALDATSRAGRSCRGIASRAVHSCSGDRRHGAGPGGHRHKIGEMGRPDKDIASHTNLLALNATIEALAPWEGRASVFAVVGTRSNSLAPYRQGDRNISTIVTDIPEGGDERAQRHQGQRRPSSHLRSSRGRHRDPPRRWKSRRRHP